jgi:hypothetical protein
LSRCVDCDAVVYLRLSVVVGAFSVGVHCTAFNN